tara:strand:- start:66 stop:554 length:489 start_codon:yes stop_codon:yes gene_type:complete
MSVVVELAVLEMVWVLTEVEVSSVLYLQQVVEVELSKTKTEDLVGQVEETELMEMVGMNLQDLVYQVKDILAVKVGHLKTQPLVEVVVQTKQEKTDITDQIVDLHREETENLLISLVLLQHMQVVAVERTIQVVLITQRAVLVAVVLVLLTLMVMEPMALTV